MGQKIIKSSYYQSMSRYNKLKEGEASDQYHKERSRQNQVENRSTNSNYSSSSPHHRPKHHSSYSGNSVPPPTDYESLPVSLQNHPEIQIIRDNMVITCRVCGSMESYARKIAGCASFSWCVCLFMFTGFLGFWIPFCMDRCYDVEIVCKQCGYVKSSLEANCF